MIPRLPIARFIRKWRVEWAVFALVSYLLTIPITIIVFPDSNIWLAMLFIWIGVTDGLGNLADLLTDDEDPT